ncbi:hypothetical protein ACFY4C_26395 [Actinomadura viridis]|uniref:hypothetical protein n=1 Tax=Actinomadura viridis TaxID=58110 RepID=UPI00368A4A6B
MKSVSLGAGGSAVAALAAAGLVMAPGAARAESFTYVPCNASALINAINDANAAGGSTQLNLARSCSYGLTSAASTGTRGPNGLPIITANISLTGQATTIRRIVPARFRILEVSQGARFQASGIGFTGGDSGVHTGGGILNARGSVELISANVRGNTADNGAGISNDRGQLRLTGTFVQSNSTSGGGGGGIYNDGILTVTGGGIESNTAVTRGGGVYTELGGASTFYNSYISRNRAVQGGGGGLYNGQGGQTTLVLSRVEGNSAGAPGGGVRNDAGQRTTRVQGGYIGENTPDNCGPPGTVLGC